MTDDPVARARAIAARLSAATGATDVLGKRKSRWGNENDGLTVSQGNVGDRLKKKIYIPVDQYPDVNFMGLLIGPQGSTQKRMEETTGAKILIRGKGSSKVSTGDPDENEDLHVLISGDTTDQIERAQRAVEEILFNPEQAQNLKKEQLRRVAEMKSLSAVGGSIYGPAAGVVPAGQPQPVYGSETVSFNMVVPRRLVGYIIGRGGEMIRDLQVKSGAHIQVVREEENSPPDQDRYVAISGSPETTQKAQQIIQDFINEKLQIQQVQFQQTPYGTHPGIGAPGSSIYGPAGSTANETITVVVPNEKVGLIIGKGGMTIKSLQQRTGCSVLIPAVADADNPTQRSLTLNGDHQSIENAKEEILTLVTNGDKIAPLPGTNNVFMQIPDSKIGMIIGKKGDCIRSIMERNGVRVQIPQQPDPGSNPPIRTICISGPGEGPNSAKAEIDSIVQGQTGTASYYGYQQQQAISSYYGFGASSVAATGYDAATYQAALAAYAQQYPGYEQYYQQYAAAAAAAATTGTTVTAGITTEATTTAIPSTNGDNSAASTIPQSSTSTAGNNTASIASTTSTNNAGATAGTTDPNDYWNGYYEYAAYYGLDAANKAWGVTTTTTNSTEQPIPDPCKSPDRSNSTDVPSSNTATITSPDSTTNSNKRQKHIDGRAGNVGQTTEVEN